jgi:aryl-alcohol dehydrogenase-like predicted oxidoreductase
MQYRRFGKTELLVSEIGFGAWAIGGNARVGEIPIGWGQADDHESHEAIHAALHNGINFFDTADFYGLGHSELLLGNALKEHPDVIIASKVGHRSVSGKIVLDYSYEYIISACEQSLKRLGREAIDYYQLHSAQVKHFEQGECIEAMERLKQQGKIRYWGVSLNTFNPFPEARYLIHHKLGHGLQLVLNLINQRAKSIVREAGENDLGIIARMPLQFGLLTGKFTSKTKFETDDHRSFRLTEEIIKNTLKVLDEKVWPIARAEQMSKTAIALNFILNFPEVSTVITGIRTTSHVQQNTSGIKKLSDLHARYLQSLSEEDWKPVMEMMEKQG